jgi:hypothetical protein
VTIRLDADLLEAGPKWCAQYQRVLVTPAKAGAVRLQAQLIREVQVFPRYTYSGL